MMPHTAATLLAVLALFVGEHKLSQAQTTPRETPATTPPPATTSLPTTPAPQTPTTVSFFKNETVMEGEMVEVCVNITIGSNLASEVVDAGLMVLPQSTATGGEDYVPGSVPQSVSFTAPFIPAYSCFSIQTFADSATGEDSEVISIALSTSQQGVEVDSLGSLATVTIICRNGDIRLVGGIDGFQGRVEVCYNGEWGTVCDDLWDSQDAAVVCRQLGFSGGPVASGEALFGEGSGQILLDDVQCTGNESRLDNCTHDGFTVNNCDHSEDAGVDCMGRLPPTPSPPPTISFEESSVLVVEGDSVMVCAVVSFGTVTQSFFVFVTIQPLRKKRVISTIDTATAGVDFTTVPPLMIEPREGIEIEFSPGSTRSCVTINTIEDEDIESDIETIPLGLENFREANFEIGGLRSLTVNILDNDMNCTEGDVLCVDVSSSSQRCTPLVDVCNGVPNCPDDSDETNCPDICPPDVFTCRIEGKCFPNSYVCDSYPDCIVGAFASDELGCVEGCTNGDVQLVEGFTDNVGIARICVNANYLPVSSLNLTVVEASMLCKELGAGQVGYPTSAINLFSYQLAVPSGQLAVVSCPSSATSLAQCTVSTPEEGSLSDQAGLTCLSTSTGCADGEIRISPDGPSVREGRVEVCYKGVWGAIYDDTWATAEAAVVCRELGYQSLGAVPINGAVYSAELFPFLYERPDCRGDEARLLDCPTSVGGDIPLSGTSVLGRPQLSVSRSRQLFYVAGVRCDEYLPDGCNDLDVRLTYRDATGSSGQFEICNVSTWSTTCNNYFNLNDARVACNQLLSSGGTAGEFMSSPLVLSETLPRYTAPLSCSGSETNISNCIGPIGPPIAPPTDPPTEIPTPPPGEARRKRLVESCTSDSQPRARCGRTPFLTLTPRYPGGVYTVEVGRNILIQCQVDSTVIPTPFASMFGRRSPQTKRGVSTDFSIRQLFTDRLTKSSEGEYVCDARSSLGMITEMFRVNVLDPFSSPSSNLDLAFLRFSFLNFSRYQALGTNETASELAGAISTFVFLIIPESTPGVQNVSCYVIPPRIIDTERGLDRYECAITQVPRDDDQEVITANRIAERLASIIEFTQSFIVDSEVFVPPTIGFVMNESRLREGGSVDVCLTVTSGEITSPTSIILSTRVNLPDDSFPIDDGNFPGGFPQIFFPTFPGRDYNTNPETDPELQQITLGLSPGERGVCVEVVTVANNFTDPPVRQATFSLLRANTTVILSTANQHDIFILDDDRNCTEEMSVGSRLCVNLEALSVTCLDPALVCNYNVVFDCPDMSDELNCPSPIEDLVNQTITEETYGETTTTVSSFAAVSANPNSSLLQTSEFLSDISVVFANVADFVNGSNITINATVVTEMVSTLNSLIQWNPDSLVVNSSSSVLQSFEMVASLFAQQDNFTVDFVDISFVAEVSSTENFQAGGSSEDFGGQAGVAASIDLPPSLFDLVPDDRPVIGVFFVYYERSVLFPVIIDEPPDNTTTRARAVGSPVVAATVGPGITFVNIDPPVLITLGLPNAENISRGSESCVSWDFDSNSWVTEGCLTERVGDIVNCRCNHLTNFAVLVDICSRAQDCENDPVADSILSVITYIGVVISCIGLIITIITLLAFKKLRERDNSKYHIQLSIAILCMLIVFAAGIEQVQVYEGCVIVSILIHYFSLAAVMWMGAEALLMFQKLVIVFSRTTTKFIVILSLVCWLIPLIPVLIPMIVDLADNTKPETDLIISRNVDNTTGTIIITGGFCFIKNAGVFFGAFLGPIFAVILFNLVMFIWVIVILVRHTKGQLDRSKESIKPGTVIRLMISISGVMFLFGLTWLFAAFTFTIAGSNVVRIAFQALFVVFASFQGFFIFLFFCVFNKEARESWREVLSCGKYRSEFLHPSQYKPSSGVGTNQKNRTGTTGASSTLGGTAYHSNTIDKSTFDSEAPPLSEKHDLSKVEKERHSEFPLKAENEMATSSFKPEPTTTVAETHLDIEDKDSEDKNKWEGAEPVLKARVKRYSTKKAQKHHIEEIEIDFSGSEDSDSEGDKA